MSIFNFIKTPKKKNDVMLNRRVKKVVEFLEQEIHKEFKAEISFLKSELNKTNDLIKKLRERAEFWHGKYSIVKQENNTLRKRLYQQNKK